MPPPLTGLDLDREAIENNKLVVCAITPLVSKDQIQPYRKQGYFIDPNWVTKRVHLYLIFKNPLTNKIDVTTSYNSPTDPPHLLFCDSDDAIHARDIEAVIDPEKREQHHTVTCIVEKEFDLGRLAESLAYFRERTKAGLKDLEDGKERSDDLLPLYDGEGLSPAGVKDCQIGTLDIFRRAFPEEKLPLPGGASLTRLGEANQGSFILPSPTPFEFFPASRDKPSADTHQARAETKAKIN